MERLNSNDQNIGKLLKDEMLAELEGKLQNGEVVTFMVRGWSMRPLLFNLRDQAVIYPVSEPLRCGQVVVFKYHGRMLLHRIVKIEGDNLTIQGDGVPYRCEKVTRGDVVAVLGAAIRKSGKRVSCDSKQWIRLSKRWAALPKWLKYMILKFLRVLEIIKII